MIISDRGIQKKLEILEKFTHTISIIIYIPFATGKKTAVLML